MNVVSTSIEKSRKHNPIQAATLSIFREKVFLLSVKSIILNFSH